MRDNEPEIVPIVKSLGYVPGNIEIVSHKAMLLLEHLRKKSPGDRLLAGAWRGLSKEQVREVARKMNEKGYA